MGGIKSLVNVFGWGIVSCGITVSQDTFSLT